MIAFPGFEQWRIETLSTLRRACKLAHPIGSKRTAFRICDGGVKIVAQRFRSRPIQVHDCAIEISGLREKRVKSSVSE